MSYSAMSMNSCTTGKSCSSSSTGRIMFQIGILMTMMMSDSTTSGIQWITKSEGTGHNGRNLISGFAILPSHHHITSSYYLGNTSNNLPYFIPTSVPHEPIRRRKVHCCGRKSWCKEKQNRLFESNVVLFSRKRNNRETDAGESHDTPSSLSNDGQLFDVDTFNGRSTYGTVDEGASDRKGKHGEGGDDQNSLWLQQHEEEDDDDWTYYNEDDDDEDIYYPELENKLNYDNNNHDSSQFVRDEDDMLSEREDRLYTDEKGITRQLEKCILVGVEDLSAARRYVPSISLQHRQLAAPSTTSSSTSMTTTTNIPDVYFSLTESMNEMKELIKTAGMVCVGEITQRLNEPNRKTYVGTGKVKEAIELMKSIDQCCTIVFDAELSPGQQKALENMFNKDALQNDFLVQDLEIKVLDRTALILDIFAQHARTREGKLQVDLALHEYRKPRLTRMWTHLERQSGSGGVGLRGPGESQLEIDKRLLRDRIITLKKKINDVQKQRQLHRRGRHNLGLPILSLVGYTNAGKTTLLNYLTRAGAMAENILFATLDPTTRKVKLPGFKTHPEVLITDTVGFIQKLPTQLVAAFRATLEEVQEANVLVHVIDVSNPMWTKQEKAVLKVLREIGAGDKPIVRVLNKIDLLENDAVRDTLIYDAAMDGNSVAVSSVTGQGMEDLVSYIEEALVEQLVPIELVIPYSNGDDINIIHEVGHVETIDYRPNGTYVFARLPIAIANRLKRFVVVDDESSSNEHDDKTYTAAGKHSKGTKEREIEEEIDWTAIGRGRHAAKDSI